MLFATFQNRGRSCRGTASGKASVVGPELGSGGGNGYPLYDTRQMVVTMNNNNDNDNDKLAVLVTREKIIKIRCSDELATRLASEA